MVYSGSYFKKELKGGFVEKNASSALGAAGVGALMALLAFCLHFFLSSLQSTVLGEVFPQLSSHGYFSVLYVYNAIMLVFFLCYFLYRFRFITFSEINENKWYLLIKMGYKPLSMTAAKLFARLLFLTLAYVSGFCICLIFTMLLRYSFDFSYILPMLLSGWLSLAVLVFAIMLLSLFVKNRLWFSLSSCAAFAGLTVLKMALGYADKFAMPHLARFPTLFTSAYFWVFLALAVLICGAICFLAPLRARRYSLTKEESYVKMDAKSGGYVYRAPVNTDAIKKIALGVVGTLISLAIALNVFLLFLNVFRPENGQSIGGRIPYIFAADNMKPDINQNDFTLFKKVDKSSYKNGDIILFYDNGKPIVQKIVVDEGDIVICEYSVNEGMVNRRAIRRDFIAAKLEYKNRTLGLMIVAASGTLGRFVLLVVPVIMIVFRKQLAAIFVVKAPKTKKEDLLGGRKAKTLRAKSDVETMS